MADWWDTLWRTDGKARPFEMNTNALEAATGDMSSRSQRQAHVLSRATPAVSAITNA
ncbi:hypothetical protein GCM10011415_25050 [Salipiger pallidus]|uniref:Uncharacterized protein n=1 Tax=Salipiger pallidus TaxID=1775170 RepID=A0A8J2ZL09_9RHOB|nr:hypothetical protein GCM10011415_25050 [Salipiger pallidus]